MKTTQQQIEDLQKQLDELKASVKGEIEEDMWYWYVDDMNDINDCQWEHNSYDNFRLNINNLFLTREEALTKQTYNNALAEVNKFIREEGLALENVDWGDKKQEKWLLHYWNGANDFQKTSSLFIQEFTLLPYLKSEEACELLIEKQKENLLILMGK